MATAMLAVTMAALSLLRGAAGLTRRGAAQAARMSTGPEAGANDPLSILIFEGSTREGRMGPRVAQFCENGLRARGHEVHRVDPRGLNLSGDSFKAHFFYKRGQAPEPLDHVADLVRTADAFVMCSPEYNHCFSPALADTLNHFGATRIPSLGGGPHPLVTRRPRAQAPLSLASSPPLSYATREGSTTRPRPTIVASDCHRRLSGLPSFCRNALLLFPAAGGEARAQR